MTQNQDTPYVARAEDLDALNQHWTEARTGAFKAVSLTAPMGGGKRALVGELCRQTVAETQDIIICRPAFSDEEDGQGALIKLYSALYGTLHGNPILRGKVEMALNSQIPTQPARVQQWYRVFIEGLKKGAPKAGATEFQVSVPRDNPLIAFIEILFGISRKFPTLVDFQNLHNIHSLSFFAMLEALLDEGSKSTDLKMLAILHMLPVEGNESWIALPLQDLLTRKAEHISNLQMTAWGEDEVGLYLKSKSLETTLATKIAALTKGRPGYIAEMVDWMKEDADFAASLPTATLDTIVDFTPDETELEAPEASEDTEGEQKRQHVGVNDGEDIAYLASLLGLSFPSGLIADMGNYDRNSVDDLFDASEHIYKELQHSKPLNTWIYQFKRAIYRDAIQHRRTSDKDKQVAINVGMFLERFFVPRSYGYLTKTLRIYAEAGESNRANAIRNVAMSSDQPQIWNLARDIFNYFDECDWADAMKRTTFLHLSDRMVNMGNVEVAEQVINESLDWADSKDDKIMRAFLLMSGSRLDRRRQDLYRARDRANEALSIYQEAKEENLTGEALAQIALIELADGKTNAALKQAKLAEETANIPPVLALCRFVQGAVAQREKKLKDAAKYFEEANQLAGQSGKALLALEAGMKLGETLLGARQASKAADVLSQVLNMARSIKAPAQERAVASMLAQAHGAQQNFEAALQASTRTLELTRQLGFQQMEAVDTYNVGLFNLMLKRPSEAVALFKQAQDKVTGNANPNFMKELLFNLGMSQIQIGEKNAGESNIRDALPKANQVKDWTKLLVGHQQLAELAKERGDVEEAQKQYADALKIAEQTKNTEARKRLKERMKGLRA